MSFILPINLTPRFLTKNQHQTPTTMKVHNAKFSASIIAAILSLASNSPAATWYVATTGSDSSAGTKASPYASIKKAMSSATNGDTINVLPGTYQGSGNCAIALSGKQLTLRSLNGPSNTIIDLQGNYAIKADGSISNNTVIDGFTFKNGYYSTSTDWRSEGIITIHNGLTINDCVFYSNTVVAAYVTTGTAIIAQNWVPDSQQPPSINNCLFYSNSIGGGASLGWAWGRASVIGSGASSQATSVNMSVQNCTIANNRLYTAVSGAAGLLIPLNAGMIVNCITWNNTPAYDPAHPSVTAQTWAVQSQAYSISQDGFNASYNSNITTINAITNNPLFVNPALGDYSLKPTSPAKNAGSPNSLLNIDGTRADMGYRSDLANIRSVLAPLVKIFAPANTPLRLAIGPTDITNVTASILPSGWQFDAASGQIFGRMTGTNPISALLTGEHGTNPAVPVSDPVELLPQVGQSIAFTARASAKVGDIIPLITTSSSKLPVSVTSSDPNILRVDGSNAAALSKGRVTLTATQDGNEKFAPATPISRTVTVR
jgi:hypothetical protein